MSMQQYQTTKQGGPFVQVTTPIPKPGLYEVCIRTRAVALNALDWKNIQFGFTVLSWPAVIGIEAAGVVESVGDGVTLFKPGDEVMSWVHEVHGNGAFQDVYISQEIAVARKPMSLSFEEAISSRSGRQLWRRFGCHSTPVYRSATLRHHHHDQLGRSPRTPNGPGATKCLERAAQNDAAAMRAASPGGAGVDAIIDAVAAGPEAPAVYDVPRSDGPKLYSLVTTQPDMRLPVGPQAFLVGAEQMLDKELRAKQYLRRLLEEGKYKLPLKVESDTQTSYRLSKEGVPKAKR
ncbi:GroES-like protein [Thozetella sp. PMI_491]|nr:GroES-like protein [Thozetella sp. PMI_491]